MRLDRNSFAGTAADVTTVDLADIAPGDVQAGLWKSRIANFDIEVVGNDASVTVTGKGPFASSAHQDISGGTFAIGGGKISVQGFCLSELEFTTAGGAYTINITREVAE